MTNEINLGHIPRADMRPMVMVCNSCQSKDIGSVRADAPNKQMVNEFVRVRASRLGVSLADYDVRIDKETGAVTATPKTTDVEVSFD